MGTNNLTNRSSGQTIVEAFFNDIHTAFNADFVGRNSSGVPTSGQSLGTSAFPWGTGRFNGLVIGGSTLDVSQISAPANRVVSGTIRATSNQPIFLDPAGAAGGASFDLLATGTDFIFDVNGVSNTISADITKSGLTVAPSANNTALIDDTDAVDQAATRTWGEAGERKSITIDNAGTEITSRVGEYHAFSHGTGEIFYGKIASATSITKVRRGFAYDAAGNPFNREVFTNNDTLTLLNTGYVFVDDDGATVDVSFNEPVWSSEEPSGAVSGDYWIEFDTSLVKRHNGTIFVAVDRVFSGWVFLDDTDCIGARCIHFDARYKDQNDIDVEIDTTAVIKGSQNGKIINVAGTEIEYQDGVAVWNMANDLASGADMYDATEQANRDYYFYISDKGEPKISDIEPYDFQGVRYHPHNPWRLVATGFNDGSSDLTEVSPESRFNTIRWVHSGNGSGAVNTSIRRFSTIQESEGTDILYTDDSDAGALLLINRPGWYSGVYVDQRASGGGAVEWGWSVNSTQLTTSIDSIAAADRIGMTQWNTVITNTAIFGTPMHAFFNRGDEVRLHADGTPNSTSAHSSFFRISRDS